MPPLPRHKIIRSSQKAYISDFETSLLHDLAGGTGFWCFAKYEVAAGEGPGSGAVGVEAFADQEAWIFEKFLRGLQNEGANTNTNFWSFGRHGDLKILLSDD